MYGFDDYPDAPIENIPSDVEIGSVCAGCSMGRMYKDDPSRGVCFSGHAPVTASRYERQVLRCNRCGRRRSSPKKTKWTSSARSAMVLQKCHGMPFHRLSKLQRLSGVPVAPSTAWYQCEALWLEGARCVYDVLLTLCIKSALWHVDDTRGKILCFGKDGDGEDETLKNGYTTILRGRRPKEGDVVVFMTSGLTAGRKLGSLVDRRGDGSPGVLTMTDASSMKKIPIAA